MPKIKDYKKPKGISSFLAGPALKTEKQKDRLTDSVKSTLYVDREIWAKLGIKAIEQNTSRTELLNKALREYLK